MEPENDYMPEDYTERIDPPYVAKEEDEVLQQPEPTPQPTPEPTPVPVPTTAPATQQEAGSKLWLWILLAVAAIVAAALFV